MGTLRKRGDKFQMIVEVYRKRRRFFKSKTFSTEEAALAWERKILYEIDKGLVTRESLKRRTLADAINKYVTTVLPHKPKNSRNVIQHLKWWDQQIGGEELSDITPAVLAEFRDRLLYEPGLTGVLRKNNTVIRYIASISVVLEYAVKEWMWLPLNPVRSIKKPRAGTGKTRYFTQEEIRIIKERCAASNSKSLLPIFILALHSGMRRGEVLSLRWENVSFKDREIYLPTSKSGDPRDICMTDEVFEVLSSLYKSTQNPASGLLFPSSHDPNKPVNIQSAWERVLTKAGIEGATFHTIRHTTCSYLAQLGISPILISRIAGHKDSKTTDRYTHAVKTHIREAMDRFEILLNK